MAIDRKYSHTSVSPEKPPRMHAGGFTLSPLLVGAVVAAVAATLTLVMLAVVGLGAPPSPSGPPPSSAVTALIINAALFVLAWVAVVLAFCRDALLRHIDDVRETLEASMSAVLSEYGEQRETDGYLYGVRAGGRNNPASTARPDVRPFHPVPPHDESEGSVSHSALGFTGSS